MFVRVSGNPIHEQHFDVNVRHADDGWDHYADAWQTVAATAGYLFAERILAHPHTDEQPFTRSFSGVVLPPVTQRVRIRARCNGHGFGRREKVVDLKQPWGDGYEVLIEGGRWPGTLLLSGLPRSYRYPG